MPSVIVVGAGLAGLACALEVARHAMPVTLVSAQSSERSQSVLAEGGINAALDLMGEHDTVREHFEDTMRGGCDLADPNAVWGLVSDAPAIIGDLLELGVPFQREDGRMVQRAFGGQKKMRTAFAQSSTGKVLVCALVDAVRRYEGRGLVTRMPHHELRALSMRDGRCVGCIVHDAFRGTDEAPVGPVVLCCGGMGGLFGYLTTGSTTNTGDVAALALAQGVELANLEFVQYHPTTVPIAGKRLLVSEAARGEGGRLYVERGGRPYYFMEERYPKLGNLMPRDVVSREEWLVQHDPALGDQVYLDLTGIPRAVWEARLSDMHEELEHYLGLDVHKSPVPVEPGIHYTMGGLLVDERHQTSVGGLYAAGECACAYHGANRLGGNSLLGAIRGGKVAAAGACEDARAWGRRDRDGATCDMGPEVPHALETERAMREVLAASMGIVRDGDRLDEARVALEGLAPSRRVLLARALVRSALAREESRGAHMRLDHPDTSAAYRKTTVVTLDGGEPRIQFRDIPHAREGVGA